MLFIKPDDWSPITLTDIAGHFMYCKLFDSHHLTRTPAVANKLRVRRCSVANQL